jgi:hypothetical protein
MRTLYNKQSSSDIRLKLRILMLVSKQVHMFCFFVHVTLYQYYTHSTLTFDFDPPEMPSLREFNPFKDLS